MNLYDVFLQMAENQPDHPIVVTAAGEFSYRSVRNQVQYYVARLRELGVAPGDLIGLHYANSLEYISLTYAIWGCGACVVPIPIELSAQEKRQIFHDICIDAVLSRSETLTDLKSLQAAPPQALFGDAVYMRTERFREAPAGLNQVNPAFVRFSSGTTGTAKGVVLSHESIYARIQAANQVLHLGPEDRVVWLLSMAYHFAVSIVAYVSFGATILLCPNTFGATIIRLANRWKATILYAAPVHYSLMTHDRGKQMLPSVRLSIATTTSLSPDVAAAFYRRFQKPLNETYGIIEVGLPCINVDQPSQKQGSVGRVSPAYDLRIEPIGDVPGPGAILLRGEGLVDAYYEPWQTREEILRCNDGWFATGDLGEVDDEGFLYIRGRSKEVISVGGMKFFPQEVEAVLESHPAVQEACVFRYPDQRLGDIPHAHVVVNSTVVQPDKDELSAFCAEKLARHKVPEQIHFVDVLKRTASGKLIRDATQLVAPEKSLA